MSDNLRLLSYSDLEKLGYGSRVTIWRKVRLGQFPPPFVLSPQRVAWRERDVLEWLDGRAIAQIGQLVAG